MRTKFLEIVSCQQCHHYILDDRSFAERNSKSWCQHPNKNSEILDATRIPEDCPLEDSITEKCGCFE